MSTPTNTELHRTANILEDVAKLLHQGTEAFRLAEEWAGVGAAAAASDGSRSTRHNDVSSRIVTPGERDLADRRRHATLLIAPEYVDAHQRMTEALDTLRRITPTLLADLQFCQRAARTKREAANNLDRINSKSGECETCYTAGRDDSYQHGTLEAVVLATFTTNTDGDIVHEQLDLCHKCAKSARGSRANARSSGTDWDVEQWTTNRIAHLRPNENVA